MQRKLVAPVLLLGALTVSPLWAGVLYVPVERPGADAETRVWATNTGGVPAGFSTYFIPFGVDGTDRGDYEPARRMLPPGGTLMFKAPAGIGLLELNADSDIAVDARLVKSYEPLESGIGATVTVISSRSLPEFGRDIVLQGWQREVDGSTNTAFRLVNLDSEPAHCTVTVSRASGAPVTFADFPAVTPLSVLAFDDPLGAVEEHEARNVRARVACDRIFFAYGMVTDLDGTTAFISPSQTGRSTLGVPGQAPGPVPGTCPAGAACFSQPGLVHRATNANKTAGFDWQVPPGSYQRLRMTFQLKNGGWSPRGSHLSYSLFWLVKNFRNVDMFGYAFIKGPNQNTVILRHGFGSVHGDKLKEQGNNVWPEGAIYNVEYIYDTGGNFILLIVTDQNGNEVSRLSGRPDINRINYGSGGTLTLGLGNQDININEPTQVGWEWHNVHVEMIPE